MNRNGHIITSLLLLISALSGYLFYLLMDHGLGEVLTAIVLGVSGFILGVCLPDLDHHKVSKKIFFLKWIGKITHHRGHFHSIVAAIIYGSFVFSICCIFKVKYFIVPPSASFAGYFSHLLEDQLHKFFKQSKAANSLKIW